jgi:hypothetical protein
MFVPGVASVPHSSCCRRSRLVQLNQLAIVQLSLPPPQNVVDGDPPARFGLLRGIDTITGCGRRETSMRNVVLALLAANGLALVGAAPAHAVGTRYPFCIQGDQYPGLSYCSFVTYEQCQATASGRDLNCIANPYYDGGRRMPVDRRQPRPRSIYPAD